MQDLLHNLIRQQAALQLAVCQEDWDLLIPVYYGNMDQAFDCSRLSAILIQVKNRAKQTNISTAVLKLKNYSKFFSYTKDPILYILMDLGTSKTDFEILSLAKSEDMQRHLFGIHTLGADMSTFPCLKGISEAAQRMLRHVVPEDTDDRREEHNAACQRNIRFRYHDWESRFPAIREKNNLPLQAFKPNEGDAHMFETD